MELTGATKYDEHMTKQGHRFILYWKQLEEDTSDGYRRYEVIAESEDKKLWAFYPRVLINKYPSKEEAISLLINIITKEAIYNILDKYDGVIVSKIIIPKEMKQSEGWCLI